MIAAAASRGAVRMEGVGLNPTRTGVLGVLSRMGLVVRHESSSTVLGEPVGAIEIGTPGKLVGVRVGAAEMPGIIDEVPGLAALAALADGESRFEGAGELRFKESDRLNALAETIREKEARLRRPDLKALFVSGYPADSLLGRTGDDGRTVLLAKPFTVDELTGRLSRLLDGHQ